MEIQNQAMTFSFTPKAKEFLLQKQPPVLHIEAVEINQCCIPLVTPPQVRRGAPYKPEKFIPIEAEGITIYYDRELPKRPQITIDLQGVGFIKGLKISDWQIRY